LPNGLKLLDAYVEVTASARGLAAKVADEFRAESAGAASRAGSGFGSSLIGGLHSSLTSGAIGGLVGGITSQVTYGLQNLASQGFAMAKGAAIDFNSQLETSTIGFTTMLGSATKARNFLGELQQFAKTTPFEFGDLTNYAQQMMGYGIAARDIIPDLTALGDAASGAGKSGADLGNAVLAFEQMAAKGTVDLGNLNQLTNAGIPATRILAAQYGISQGKLFGLISAGKIASSDALPKLIAGIEHGTKSTAGLGGMMSKMSGTLTGAMSNISDALNQAGAKAFRPFFRLAERGANQLATFLSSKAFARWGDGVSKAMEGASKQVGPLLNRVRDLVTGKGIPKTGPVADLLKGIRDMVNRAGKAAHDAEPDVRAFLGRFTPKMVGTLADTAHAVGSIVTSVGKLSPVLRPLGDILGTLNDSGLRPVIRSFTAVSNGLNGTLKPIDMVKQGLEGKLMPSMNLSAKAMTGFWNVTHSVFGRLGAGWSDTVGKFVHGGQQILGFFSGLSGGMYDAARHVVDGFVGGLRDAWGAITSTLHDLASALPGPVRQALGIASPSKVFHTIGTQVGQGLHRGLLGTVDQIKTASAQLADAVTAGFTGANVGRNVARIRSVAKTLEGLSTRRDRATTKLGNDRSALASILQARTGFASSVRSGVMGSADVASLFMAAPTVQAAAAGTLNGAAYQPSWTTTSHTGLAATKASLRKLLTDTKAFRGDLATLVKRGIDPYTYDQLVQAGVQGGGLETARALLADRSMASSIFSLERQISSAGQGLGTATAGHEYAGQVRNARNAVARDQRAVNAINVTMIVEAKKIDEVSKLLHMVQAVKQTARKR
jgi:tape measure domain-containing protein